MNKLRRREDWPFPAVEPGEEVYVNPMGNTTKNYTADFYQSDVPGSIPQVTTSLYKDTPYTILFPPLVGDTPASISDDLSKVLDAAKAFTDELNNLPTIEADPSGGSLNEPGKKADAGKLLPWLFFSGFAHALEKVAEVTTLGAKKYTPGGWATVANGPERYMEAAIRHLIYLGQGEKYDNGKGGIGTLHKAQIIWNLLASLELELREEKKT